MSEEWNVQPERMSSIERRAVEWLRNGGIEQIAEAVRVSNEASRQFAEAARPDPATLREPCTI